MGPFLFCAVQIADNDPGISMAAKKQELMQILEPAVAGLGFELADLEVRVGRGRGLLRLFIDSPAGITLENCEAVSRQVSHVLDVEDPLPGNYHLEVSSPGLDRRLVKPAHFDRFVGSTVQVRVRIPVEGRRHFRGQLLPREGSNIAVRCEETVFRFALSEIETVRLIPVIETS